MWLVEMYYNSSEPSRESSIASISGTKTHIGSKVEISTDENPCQDNVLGEQYTKHTK